MTDSFTYRIENTKAIITGYIGNESITVIVPSKIGKFDVIGIDSRAFIRQEKFIDTVEISSGIREIGNEVFIGCRFLTRIIIPSTVQKIGDRAFAGCLVLSELRFLGDMPSMGVDILKNSDPSVTIKHYFDARGWQPVIDGRKTTIIEGGPTFTGESDDESEGEELLESGEEDDIFEREDEELVDERPEVEQLVEEQPEELWEAEEVQYVAGIRDFERVSRGWAPSTSLKNITNPSEAFRIRATGAFIKLKASAQLSEADLVKILEPIGTLSNIKFKNPAAYVLGYIASNRGRVIDRRAFDRACDILYLVNEKEIIVREPDILRYAVYWQHTVSKLLN